MIEYSQSLFNKIKNIYNDIKDNISNYLPKYLNRVEFNIEDLMIMINNNSFKIIETINIVYIRSQSIFVLNNEFLKFLKDKKVKLLYMCIYKLYESDIEQISNFLWNLRKSDSVKIIRLNFPNAKILEKDINLIISNIAEEFKKRIDYSIQIMQTRLNLDLIF